jgi:hypothetical protein
VDKDAAEVMLVDNELLVGAMPYSRKSLIIKLSPVVARRPKAMAKPHTVAFL